MLVEILNATLFTPLSRVEHGRVLIDGDRIRGVAEHSADPLNAQTEVLDGAGAYLIPGLIDLHTHGLLGHDVMGSGLRRASQEYPQRGVTSFMPTTITRPWAETKARLREMAQCLDQPLPGAVCLGIHLEGPFLSPQAPGMADPMLFMSPSMQALQDLQRAAAGRVRRMTFAPELVREPEFIRNVLDLGISPVAGHTAATLEELNLAFDAGVAQVAHLFNGMPPLHHRSPGPVAAALLRQDIFVELIADGVHLHPAIIELVLRLKGPDNVLLVSDSAPLSGLDDGDYEWAGNSVAVRGDRCLLDDGRLAGSHSDLGAAVRWLIQSGVMTPHQALQSATDTPARAAGVSDLGRIEAGCYADLVLVDRSFEPLWTMVRGEIVWRRGN